MLNVPDSQHGAAARHRVLVIIMQLTSILRPRHGVTRPCRVRAVELRVVETIKLCADVARRILAICSAYSNTQHLPVSDDDDDDNINSNDDNDTDNK